MELATFFAPVFALVVTGTVLTAVPLARGARQRGFSRFLFVFAALVAAGLVWAGTHFELLPPVLVSSVVLDRLLGGALVIAAAGLAFRGTRARRRAELWLSASPRSIDAAIDAARDGDELCEGVFRARIGAAEQVTSPGGIVCAFYEADLRAPEEDGEKGPLLSRERGHSTPVYLVGERVSCALRFHPRLAWAPLHVRRCQVGGRLALGAEPAFVSGAPPEDALSYERVGKIGEECIASGRLVRNGEGRYELVGFAGSPPMLAVGTAPERVGARFRRTSWWAFGLAACCTVVAAYVLSGRL